MADKIKLTDGRTIELTDGKIRLTDAIARKLPPPEPGTAAHKRGYEIYRDEDSPLQVRATKASVRSYVVDYRIRRRERSYTIGRVENGRCPAAREAARRIHRQAKDGVDPLADRDAKTVKQMCERYAEERFDELRESTRKDYRGIIDKEILPVLGQLKVVDVLDDDVAQLHRKIVKRGAPYRANRALAVLSSMFALAIRPWHWCTVNPCKGVKRAPEHPRERFLENGELGRLLDALAEYEDQQVADVLRMAMLTGARISEITSMRLADIRGSTWVKPHGLTKQRKEHAVPLTPPVLELLARQPQDGDQVFPGSAGRWRNRLYRAWRALRRTAELGDLRVHDLRHNYASTLVNAGYSLPVIGALLGHSKAATTQRYSHLYRGTLAEAANRAASAIAAAGKPAAEPEPDRAARRSGRSGTARTAS
jgi:integrase